MSAPAARVRRYGDDAFATPANMVTIARLVLAVPTLLLIVDQGFGLDRTPRHTAGQDDHQRNYQGQ